MSGQAPPWLHLNGGGGPDPYIHVRADSIIAVDEDPDHPERCTLLTLTGGQPVRVMHPAREILDKLTALGLFRLG